MHKIACGGSEWVLGMSFVKSAIVGAAKWTPAALNLETTVLMDLCAPWTGPGRIVCTDSYFASVQAASTLYDNGLRFTGVVKTFNQKIPFGISEQLEMSGRDDHTSMVAEFKSAGTVNYKILAIRWVDCSSWYFDSTARTTLLGNYIDRMWLHELWEGAQGVNFGGQNTRSRWNQWSADTPSDTIHAERNPIRGSY